MSLLTRALHLLPPELAHRVTIRALRLRGGGAVPPDDPILATEAFGLSFSNPVGLAAGFDKNAEAVAPLHSVGFGLIEIGSVTPLAQRGNPKPRVFRLREDRAVINRLGFNSHGARRVARRLRRYRRRDWPEAPVLGVNLGKNRYSEDAASDYGQVAGRLGEFADYVVVNVSSPNTPGLRALQRIHELDAILASVRPALGPSPPPVLIKVAPDLSDEDREDLAKAIPRWQVAGLIISNTTVARPESLKSPHRSEAGGLSGPPLFPLATETLREMYALTSGRVPLVGVGGISGPGDAYAKIRAGATLLQLYTGLVYRGPELVAEIKAGLAERLRADGFDSVEDAVGADHG